MFPPSKGNWAWSPINISLVYPEYTPKYILKPYLLSLSVLRVFQFYNFNLPDKTVGVKKVKNLGHKPRHIKKQFKDGI